MGILEEILKNKEGLLIKFLDIIEGKETRANVNLDGVQLKFGKTALQLSGNVQISVVPLAKKKK